MNNRQAEADFVHKQVDSRLIRISPEDHLVAGFAALAICIHILESALPSPLPGIKPGLANVVTLIVFCRYGWQMAAWVSLLRVLVGSILIGTFLSPTFFLSASGALSSVLALGAVYGFSRIHPAWSLGPVGLGVVAAMAHLSGQFWVAYFLFIPHQALMSLYPVLLTLSAGLGILSGVVTRLMLRSLKR